MIELTKQPNTYSFTGNPVIFEIITDSLAAIELVISTTGRDISLSAYPYSQDGIYRAIVNIADVLKSFFLEKSSVDSDVSDVITELRGFVLDYTVKIDQFKQSYHAIDGGISLNNLEVLSNQGLDMFSYRLNNPERCILFTTRTNSPYLTLKESEIFPFTFLHPGKSISFVTASDHVITFPAKAKGTPCLLNIASLRNMFFDLYDEMPSFFKMQIDESTCTYITLTPSVLTENTYFIRFKNSLGGWEQIEITGKGDYTPEFEDENISQHYTKNHFFKQKRERLEMQDVITAHSGYKSKEELHFLLDMIGSDSTYFIDSDGSVLECFVSVDNPKIPLRVVTLNSMELKITMNTKSNHYSPRLDFTAPGAWILTTGRWNDLASWKDKETWNDGKK